MLVKTCHGDVLRGAMPTYEYRCRECGKTFEISAHFDERKRLAVCPACGSKRVAPVFTPIAVSRTATLVPTKP